MIDKDSELEPGIHDKKSTHTPISTSVPVSTPISTSVPVSTPISTSVKKNTEVLRNKVETLIEIEEFETCRYWFYEVIKYSISNSKYYNEHKSALCEHIFKNVNFLKITSYYKSYIKQYKKFNKDNIIKFCKDKNNTDFIQDIKICENTFI
jgi:hypothetical protein